MAKKLILRGRVQGVFCRNYCAQYARHLNLHGSASNLSDGSVRVLLDTDDAELVTRYIRLLQDNPMEFTFYGRIGSVENADHRGTITGDYIF